MQWGEQLHIPYQFALCMRTVTRCRTQEGSVFASARSCQDIVY